MSVAPHEATQTLGGRFFACLLTTFLTFQPLYIALAEDVEAETDASAAKSQKETGDEVPPEDEPDPPEPEREGSEPDPPQNESPPEEEGTNQVLDHTTEDQSDQPKDQSADQPEEQHRDTQNTDNSTGDDAPTDPALQPLESGEHEETPTPTQTSDPTSPSGSNTSSETSSSEPTDVDHTEATHASGSSASTSASKQGTSTHAALDDAVSAPSSIDGGEGTTTLSTEGVPPAASTTDEASVGGADSTEGSDSMGGHDAGSASSSDSSSASSSDDTASSTASQETGGTETDYEEGTSPVDGLAEGGGAADEASSSASTSAQITATTSASATEIIIADESFMIGEHECMVLADGNFYCSKSADEVGGTPSAADFGPARVLAQPDHQGDQEIYLLDGGATVQLTFNDYDDLAPVIDDATLRIAWHAMVGERLQIMLYDRSTGATRQVTDTSYNNSNPHLFGDLLVWQAWVDGNWEIFLAEDLAQDKPRITRLTENTRHDMLPKVFDQYVTWEAQTPEGWHVVIYDTTTKRYSLVKKRGDGNYENPRFALLIDNRSEDGAVETIGFDVGTDEEIPLSPASAPTPDPVTPDEHSGEAALPASTGSSSKLEEGEGQR